MGYSLSVCPYCACGCGVLLESQGDRLIGSLPSVSHPSSAGSLCLRGWNAVEAPQHPDRLTAPLLRRDNALAPVSEEEALTFIAQELRALAEKKDAEILVCVGPSLTNEDAYAAERLARHLKAFVSPSELGAPAVARQALTTVYGRHYPQVEMDEIALADLVWLFGVDPNIYPQVAARLFKARGAEAKLIRFDIFTEADSFAASRTVTIPPGEFAGLSRLLERTVFRLQAAAPALTGIPGFAELAAFWENAAPSAEPSWLGAERAEALVREFQAAKAPLVLIGERWLNELGSETATAQLLQSVALLGADTRVVMVCGEVNSWGTWDLLNPQAADLRAMEDLLDPDNERRFDALLVIGDDLLRRAPAPEKLAAKLAATQTVILIDRFASQTLPFAHAVLPACGFPEMSGTTTNLFGVVQRLEKAIKPHASLRAARDWLAEIGNRLGSDLRPQSAREWFADIQRHAAAYQGLSLNRLYGKPEFLWAKLDETSRLHFEVIPPTPGAAQSPGHPLALFFGAHPALWATGLASEREHLLQREVRQALLYLSPDDIATLKLRPGSRVKVTAPNASAFMTAMEDKRLPPGVLLAQPLTNDEGRRLRGFLPHAGRRGIGAHPVEARVEKV